MDVLGQHLEAREGGNDHNVRRLAELDRKKAGEVWMLTKRRPEDRLLEFDRWVRGELSRRLEWGWAGDQREKRIEQCRLHLETMVLELWRRGWMLDGARLARRIEELLDTVGKYQRAGKVADFWAYFGAAVKRYVGANAEEIQAEAMRAGGHVNQLVASILVKGRRAEPTLPELLAQRTDEAHKAKEITLREKLARARAQQAQDAKQGQLL